MSKKSLLLVLIIAIIIRLLAIERYSETERMTYAFSGDEWRTVKIIETMVNESSLNPHFFIYPSLYSTVCFFATYISFIIIDDSWHTTIITARFMSLLFGILTIYLTYLLGKVLYNERVGLWASLFVSFNPTHIGISVLAKPDMLMLLLVMASLYFCINIVIRNNERDYLISIFLAGLAFSAKHFGLLVLSAVFLAHLLTLKSSNVRNNFSLTKNIKLILTEFINTKTSNYKPFLYLFTFSFAFLIGTPYSLLSPVDFGFGFGRGFFCCFSEDLSFFPRLLGWLYLYGFVFGYVQFIGASAGIIISLYYAKNILIENQLKIESINLFWTLFFSFTIMILFSIHDHYVILVIPSVLLMSSKFIDIDTKNLFPSFTDERLLQFKTVLFTIFLLTSVIKFSSTGIYFDRNENNYDTKYLAHDWIDANVPSDSIILSDIKVYIPNDVKNVSWNGWGQEPVVLLNKTYPFDDMVITASWNDYVSPMQLMNSTNPDYIFVSSSFYDSYLENPEKSSDRTYYYENLFAGNLNYSEVKRFTPSGKHVKSEFTLVGIMNLMDEPDNYVSGPEIVIFKKK